ncbi:MAG: signal recognition particle-docking protein FtsY [Alphaproteobacteria bacterium]|jgi:fused signal recognition particle receptor|nr:signal recognition particle-docking protein FtsY [Alphaproteobacteria bacterium]
MTAENSPGWLGRLSSGLSRSAGALGGGVTRLFGGGKLDAETLQDLDDLLVASDLGVAVAARLVAELSAARLGKEVTPEQVREALADGIEKILAPAEKPLDVSPAKPFVILVVGVNGTGKTTTIGKIAHRFRAEGKTTILAAGDTFRAAAIDQLKVWGERTGSEVVAKDPGTDAAGVVFEAVERAKATGADVVLADTAGRLQNKADLMSELEKIVRVVGKLDADAPHAILLVLDATTGQNVRSQVAAFKKICPLTGLVMTKLDGTARGGMLVAVADEFDLPVHYVGVGEGLDDLQVFDARAFARSLAGLDL